MREQPTAARLRILVANDLMLEREVVTEALRHRRPDVEIDAVAPDALDLAIAQHPPVLVIHSRADDPTWPPAIAWLAIPTDGVGVVRFQQDGTLRVLDTFGFADLLTLVDTVMAAAHVESASGNPAPPHERTGDPLPR